LSSIRRCPGGLLSNTATIRLEGEVDPARADAFSAELQQVIDEIGLSGSIRVEQRRSDVTEST